MMNSIFKTARKFAKFDSQLSVFVVEIFSLQILMSAVLATLSQRVLRTP